MHESAKITSKQKHLWNEERLMQMAVGLMGVAMIGFMVSRTKAHLAAVFIMQEAGESLFRTCFHTVFTKQVKCVFTQFLQIFVKFFFVFCFFGQTLHFLQTFKKIAL